LLNRKLRTVANNVKWLRGPKADFKVTDGENVIEIEAKFSHAKIFPCWINGIGYRDSQTIVGIE
jgi:hypothetical protein